MINFSKYIPRQETFKKPSILFLIFTACFSFWFVDFWRPYNVEKHQNNFIWDVMNYYSYLPGEFCNNGSFDFKHGSGQLFLPYGPKGTFVPKTTYGMSIMYAPFFALGYKIAWNQKSPLTGFSGPFALCVHWGSLFYVFLGLFFLRKLLLLWFNEAVTTLTLAAVLFGTMLFFYTFSQSEMTHSYLFTLFSIFLYLTHKWHQNPKYLYTCLLAFVLALIVLIRPTEIVILVFFIFWNVRSITELKLKMKLFLEHYLHIIIMFCVGVLIWVPQFIFWKNHTGSYFYFSYPGERFFWNDPQIINILFSYRKGWITYTPLIILAFVGIFFIKKDFPVSKWVFAFITALIIYILSCWWDWFFGGCFGARGFCQHIAFLAIPLAFFIDFVLYSTKKFVLQGALALVTFVFIFSCICLNIGQTYQYNHSKIHFAGMTEKIYWDVFLKYHYTDEYEFEYWRDVRVPDFDKMRNGERDQ